MSLPCINDFDLTVVKKGAVKWLLLAEGFEERSLSVAEVLERTNAFDRIIVFKNIPERKSRFSDLIKLLEGLSTSPVACVDFDRCDPSGCEKAIFEAVSEAEITLPHIHIDISVCSRLLILMLVNALRTYRGRVVFFYTEPEQYSPTRDEFDAWEDRGRAELGAFASAGLQAVIRTVGLSSSVMAGEPCVVVAFTSFNPHLVSGLLRSISPARFVLVGSSPPRLNWRERAAQVIHDQVIQEYFRDNEIGDDGMLLRSSSTFDYRETISVLSSLYHRFCFTHRIVVAPTGSKLQALGVGLFKAVCREIHIEYPMPAKYFADSYSSKDIRKIHQICFESFSECVSGVEREFGLDGNW